MTQHRPGLAAVWMLGAVAAFTLMAVAGRYATVELDTFELMLYRSIIGIFLILGFGRYFGTLHQINTRQFHLHVIRNIFHFTGQNLWFFAITLIPLAQLVALEFTTPIWVILLSPIFLGERLTPLKLFATGLGFAGILIVAQPDFNQIDIGVIAAATCAIGFAGAMVTTKILTRTSSVTCILFWLVTIQAILGIITAGWDGDIALPSPAIWPWVITVAICGLVAHLSITTALTLAPASLVSPIDFFRLPVIAIVGMILFGEPLEVFIFVGGGMIFIANYLNIRAQSRRNP